MRYELRHTDVIDKFGGGRLAKALGLPRSTVYSWRQSGVIPAKHHTAILAVAKENGIELCPADFIGRDGAISPISEVRHV